MNILGISAYFHDAAAALVQEGRIQAAVQEERFSRIKNDPAFPVNSIRFCLQSAGISIDQLDAVVFYEKPFLKFERLLENAYAYAPRGLAAFVKAMPFWIREKLFIKDQIRSHLQKIEKCEPKKLKILFSNHHLSHAASAYYASGFESSAVLGVDGVGEWASAVIARGESDKLSILKELHYPHSLGLLYSSFTYFLGFEVNEGEYKLMGLAPYGNTGATKVRKFREIIENELIQIFEDGSLRLNMTYFAFPFGSKMIREKKWEKLFGLSPRKKNDPLLQVHCDLALAIQQVTEKILLLMAGEAKKITGNDKLCMAGGVALNCTANGKLLRSGIFKEIFIQPAAGDAGGALGAALAAHYLYFKNKRKFNAENRMQNAFLGPAYEKKEITETLEALHLNYQYFNDFSVLAARSAALLTEGKALGWFQGRMEYGPRALGNRSILADPRNPQIKNQLNQKIKQRENFRPFAPVVKTEAKHLFFEMDIASPYMLFTFDLQQNQQLKHPDNWQEISAIEKSEKLISLLPAISHVDYSARVQTADQVNHPRLWKVLDAFEQLTSIPVLLNTSFNRAGEPIVCTPADACRTFLDAKLDYLILENFLVESKND